jgi:predicted nucleic acid-binding protein
VDFVITGDKDLLVLNPFAGIPIITVADVLERLGIS